MAVKQTELGKILSIVSIENEWKHDTLAEMLGIEKSTLSMIVKGERSVPFTKIRSIVEICALYIPKERIHEALRQSSIGQHLYLNEFTDEERLQIFDFALGVLESRK